MKMHWFAPFGSLLILFNLLCLTRAQKYPYFLGNRTTMVHLFEWTWPAIARECEEFLGPRGFGGVQISPPNESRIVPTRPWWERYQPISYLLTSRSGTESQLRHMIERCNRSGVRIYVDAVINHMSAAQGGESPGTAGSVGYYDDRKYPAVPYGPGDFNAPCPISNYSNPIEVRNCQLNSLLDLNQGKAYVREAIAKYMNKLIDMGVAGFRIDAAKHMWPEDLNAIYSKLHNLKGGEWGFPKDARPYIFQEVIDLGGEIIRKTDYNQLGDVTEFKYSAEIGRIFHGRNDLKWLRNWGTEWGFLPSRDALVFVDNHDNQRGHGAGGADILTHKDGSKYKMASIFMLAHPYGEVARVMSSYNFQNTDQGPPSSTNGKTTSPSFLPNGQCNVTVGWLCEHRWPEIVSMIQFRNIVSDSCVENWWDNGHNQIAFGRGKHGFVAINMELDKEMQVSVQSSLPMGSYCDILSGGKVEQSESCVGHKLIVDGDGKIELNLSKGPTAMAIHLVSKLVDGKGRLGNSIGKY